MEFVCICEKLQKALAHIESIAVKNGTLPILETVLLQTQPNGLLVKATNLEIGVQIELTAKVTTEGEIAVPASVLARFISTLGKDVVVTGRVENNQLSIETADGKTTIKGFDAKDFPLIPQKSVETSIVVNPEVFKNALKKVLFAASTNKIRPELTGIFMGFDAKKLRCATTDSFRLIETNIFLDHDQEHYGHYVNTLGSVIIPKKTCQDVIRFLCEDNTLTITVEENQVFFAAESAFLVSRLIDGTYPDYQQIVPQQAGTKVIVEKKAFVDALRRALIFSNKKTQEVSCVVDGTQLQINALSGDYGTHNSSLEAQITGEAQTVVLNAQYVLDGITESEGEKLVIEVTNEMAPVLFYSVLEDGVEEKNNFYIVMPVKNG